MMLAMANTMSAIRVFFRIHFNMRYMGTEERATFLQYGVILSCFVSLKVNKGVFVLED